MILQCIALADTAAKYCNRVLKSFVFAIPCINKPLLATKVHHGGKEFEDRF